MENYENKKSGGEQVQKDAVGDVKKAVTSSDPAKGQVIIVRI